MITKLKRSGDALVLELAPSLLESAGIDEGTALEVSVCAESLVVTPVRDPERLRKVREALQAVNEKRGDVLRRLADS